MPKPSKISLWHTRSKAFQRHINQKPFPHGSGYGAPAHWEYGALKLDPVVEFKVSAFISQSRNPGCARNEVVLVNQVYK